MDDDTNGRVSIAEMKAKVPEVSPNYHFN